MRRILVLLACLLLSALPVLAIGCGDDKEEVLVLYSGRSESLIAPAIEKFTKDTGIKVEVRYAGSVDLALTIIEEGKKSPADLFLSKSPGPVGLLGEKGHLAKLSKETLDLAPASGTGLWTAITGRQRVLVYNTELLSHDELPTTIAELTSEKWAGRIAIAPGNGSFQDFLTLFRLEAGDDVALAWLKALKDGGTQTYPKNSYIVAGVNRGEVEAGLVNHYYNIRMKAEDPSMVSENHRFADGDPGGVTIATAIGVIKSSSNQKLAERFIQWLLSERGQAHFAANTWEYPLAGNVNARNGVEVPETIDVGSFDRLGGGLERTLELIREAGYDY